MDENMIKTISEFLSKWGFWQIIAIMVIVILTAILKGPIKKAAEKYQQRTGVDKSRITWIISIIPFVLAFAAALILELLGRNWDVNLVDWAEVTKQGSVLGSASIGLFEALKKYAEAFTAKKVAAAISSSTNPAEQGPQQPSGTEGSTADKSDGEKGKSDVVKI